MVHWTVFRDTNWYLHRLEVWGHAFSPPESPHKRAQPQEFPWHDWQPWNLAESEGFYRCLEGWMHVQCGPPSTERRHTSPRLRCSHWDPAPRRCRGTQGRSAFRVWPRSRAPRMPPWRMFRLPPIRSAHNNKNKQIRLLKYILLHMLIYISSFIILIQGQIDKYKEIGHCEKMIHWMIKWKNERKKTPKPLPLQQFRLWPRWLKLGSGRCSWPERKRDAWALLPRSDGYRALSPERIAESPKNPET